MPGLQGGAGRAQGFRERLASIGDPLALLEGMFAHLPVPCIVFTADGHPLVNNPAYREMFGAEPPPEYNVLEDEVAKSVGLDAAVRRAFEGHTVRIPVVWYDPKQLRHIRVVDARRVAIACTFFPLFDPNRQVTHVAATYEDVTAELQARQRAETERDQLKGALRRTEELARALRASEERLRDTLEVGQIGIWEWDIEGDRVEWSANIEGIFGLPKGTFAGTYEAWLALVHPEDRGWMNAKVADALRHKGAYEAEFRFLRGDGSTGWQSARGQVVTDEQGRAKLLRGTVFDATEQVNARLRAAELAEALRMSEARYRTFVTRSSEGIWRFELTRPVPVDTPVEEQVETFFRDAFLAESNDAMARMYGYETAEALNGKPLRELLVPDDPRNREYLSAFVQSGYRLDNAESYEVDRHGNRRIFHNSTVGIVEQGRLVRAWGMQRDVTAQVEARQEAEAANRAKDEFLAMLGHELRNPLSPILTALELMELRGADTFANERAIIARQLEHVVRLVDDLLDISRVTRGNLPLERCPVDLFDSISGAIELASPLLEQRAHRLTVDVPRGLVVEGDATRLRQVFANLLTNAAKYTPPGGHVTILGDAADGHARIRVRDTGIGIRPELSSRIFDTFVQARQTLDRSEGGLGLGLAIVRSLVELHRGSVEAHSEGPGRGSEFSVRLPLSPSQQQPAAAQPSSSRPAPGEGRRILLVDDNEDLTDLLADALSQTGNDVRVAHDGPAALRALEQFSADVALIDIGLPVMNGYEVARRIRACPSWAGMRLIAVTGYGQAQDRELAKAAGFDQHLVKPVQFETLESVLDGSPPA